MSVFLKDTVKLNDGLQGQIQGAGTPNKAGIGCSSIINTTVATGSTD